MNDATPSRDDLRSIARQAVRAEITQRAIALLDERGFDQTTVEELSAAVGISPRSFFRYFPNKEDVAIGDLMPMGDLVEKALLERPEDETAWAALRAALGPLVRIADSDPDNVRRSTRVALSTPGLRAKTIERHTAWAAVLAPIVARRLDGTGERAAMAAEAITQSALACLYVATAAWSSGSDQSYSRLLDEAFDAVAQL
ncbi:AcrR family transcriptional regulator [Conyzicola lurida]|uniref:AcrR family transcriptional regulator n=1 Tax=Conyzicola lurida TaxID=1172621 RepID=A0A841AH84_9MICO|nr:TetR family transcriptional regulator [Conyzicola lurida]MBB5841708.1 AcrR family transcriptional regulator [Conyzicola lurida]